MFSATAAKVIQEFNKSHHKIGLSNFMHDITFGKGQISMLVSNSNIASFYSENQIPMLCTDESGRTLSEGIYINKILQEQYKDCAVLMPLMVKVAQKVGQNFGKNSLHVVMRENDCQHLYSLFFDLSECDFLQWIINNGNLVRDLIENYMNETSDIIIEAKLPQNRIVLPDYSAINLSSTNSVPQKLLSVFHKSTHLPIYLSKQQSYCLRLLMQGKSAKKIAMEMNLSHRTIEHYLEKIRKILGCNSNKELIVSYHDQVINLITNNY